MSTNASTATTVTPPQKGVDVEEIEKYLKETVKIGTTASETYATKFVENGIDSVAVLQIYGVKELETIMNSIPVSKMHQTLIIKSLKNSTSEKQKTDEQKLKVEEAKKEAEKVRIELISERNSITESTLQKLNESLAKITAGSAESWTLKPKTTKELLTDLNNVIDKLKIVEESCTKGNYSSNAELINSISSSGACKAIHFVNDQKFGDRAARSFLDFMQSAQQFGDLTLNSAPGIQFVEETFTNSGEYSLFDKRREAGGFNSASSAKLAGFYGGFVGAASLGYSTSTQNQASRTSSDQVVTNHVIQETIAVVSMNSFTLSPSKFVLNDDALNELKAISSQEKAKNFLHQHGTHILLTDHVTGGTFVRTAEISFSAEVNKTKRDTAIAKAKEFSAGGSMSFGLSFGASGGTSLSNQYENGSFSAALNSGETYSCCVNFKTVGPQVFDPSTFKVALGTSSKTHCLISNGFDPNVPSTWSYVSVWNVAETIPEIKEHFSTVPKLLRDAWLSIIFEKKTHLENFMVSVVERCLNEPLPVDDSNWNVEWKTKLETSKLKDSIVLGEKSTKYTNWSDGAYKEPIYLDRHDVSVPKDSVLLGFHLERQNDDIRYQINYSTLGTELEKNTASLKNIEDHFTNWEDGAVKELAYLDRHQIKAGDNRVLIGFVLQRHDDKLRFKYQTAEIHLEKTQILLSDEQVHYSSWEEGAKRKEPCYLDRQHVCVPSGRVLVGFVVERQDWQIRYKYLSRSIVKQ